MSRAVLVGVLMGVLALVGCTALAQLGQLQAELDSAGYTTTNLNHNTTNGHDTLVIEATMDGSASTADADRIAEIVWTRYPVEVDELLISIDGEVSATMSAGALAERFGSRPAGQQAGDSGPNVTIIVVAVVVALLLAGLVVLIWWRGRRPPPPVAPPPGNPQMPNPYQHPPQFPSGP